MRDARALWARGSRIARGTAAAIGLAIGVALVAVPAPAVAAGSIGISDDGVTYAPAYPGTLFDSIARLVPLDSQSSQFFIRNDHTDPTYLRIVLHDVSYSDPAYGAALSVSASTPGHAGAQTALTAASPCVVLVQGQTVQPGEVVPVTAVLALGDLSGTAGQNATAALSMRIELHDTSTGSLPATTCATPPATTPSTDVVVVPPVRPRPGGGTAVVVPTAPDEPTEGGQPSTGDGEELPGDNLSSIDPNTWQLYEERWWFVFLLAFATGSFCFMIVDWVRRRRGLEDVTEMDE